MEENQGITPAEGELGESPPPVDDAPTDGGDDIQRPGFQQRISELTKKRRDAERDAAYWRGVAEGKVGSTPAPTSTPKKELDPNDFDSDSDYLKAVAKQTRDEIRAEREEERKRENDRRTKEAVSGALSASRVKYPDFDDVALNPSIPISQDMYNASLGDNLGDILYHLGKNPAEAARIASLPPLIQAKEIGKIEAKIASKPNPKPTGAPPPPKKVGSGGSPPRKPESEMSRAELHAEWDRERRKQLGVANV